MQKNRYQWRLSDVCIMCQKTGIIKFFCLMLISSDAVKRDIMEFSLMLISSDVANRYHWSWSDVNIIRCRKTRIVEVSLMFIWADAEKDILLKFFWWSDDINIRQNSEVFVFLYLMILTSDKIQWKLFFLLISSDTEKQKPLNFVWC